MIRFLRRPWRWALFCSVIMLVTCGSGSAQAGVGCVAAGGVGSSNFADSFDGSGPLLGYVTSNAQALPDVSRSNGRYRAVISDNSDDKTLHFNNRQGRLDAKPVSFPFDYVARNIGIGTLNNSQNAPGHFGRNMYIFAGVQIHDTNLQATNSSHVVVGHRGGTPFVVEGKNTCNGDSSVNDAGPGSAPNGRVDLRIVGDANRTLTVYYQNPNFNHPQISDNWKLYRGSGKLPGVAPQYGDSVYIGLITYAQGTDGLPFVGTADAIELYSSGSSGTTTTTVRPTTTTRPTTVTTRPTTVTTRSTTTRPTTVTTRSTTATTSRRATTERLTSESTSGAEDRSVAATAGQDQSSSSTAEGDSRAETSLGTGETDGSVEVIDVNDSKEASESASAGESDAAVEQDSGDQPEDLPTAGVQSVSESNDVAQTELGEVVRTGQTDEPCRWCRAGLIGLGVGLLALLGALTWRLAPIKR